MVRRVFFSFHKDRDVWRANVVRNSWVTKPDREAAGFFDAAEWERVKQQGDEVIRKWIDSQLKGTSVTVVLIGAETSSRDWVKYEIKKSYEKSNGLLGVYIHQIKNQGGFDDWKGDNPFDNFYIEQHDQKMYLSNIYPTYDWIIDDGYNEFGSWVEKAARQAER